MRQGKLTSAKLRELIIDKIQPQNDETVVGAGVGEDCCAVMTGDLCVVSTDPITAGGGQTGTLAIHINANDVAAAGAVPIAALVTILLPPSCGEQEIKKLMSDLTEAAHKLSIDIIGGHTEVTDSVNRVVVSVTMIGKPVVPGKMFKTSDMQPGDDILITKYAGLEGTAIISEIFCEANVLTEEEKIQLCRVRESLSVVTDGCIAAKVSEVHAMHDITEGGVLGAVSEMCEASGIGADIDLSKVPVLPITKRICETYDIDVFGLISSGSMMIAAQDGAKVIESLKQNGISAAVIGKAGGKKVYDISSGERQEIVPYPADELYKVLERKQ